ncbi:MAG: zinc dependent phospholipase C family protein [Bacteroidetes bacterium]|nr:zinc dependent phospholipase C family protein [Bacteroidota bacterium]
MRLCIVICITWFFGIHSCRAYSILTHESVIDAVWDKDILPLLKHKYPAATPQQLKDARAYAYGGVAAPDMGYNLRGSKLFTDLIHYVRSGDLVTTMLEEADSLNEYAFALGFLAHYYADVFGHSIGINQSIPVIFPKLKKRYGDTVIYSQNRVAHARAELSFDMVRMVRSNYRVQNFHDYVGFKISEQVLKRAFLKTYGLRVEDLFSDFPKAVVTFKWSIQKVYPYLTRKAWKHKKEEILKSAPGTTHRNYIYRLPHAKHSPDYAKPGLLGRMGVVVLRYLPRVGSLRKLSIVVPDSESEKLFLRGFDSVVLHYHYCISELGHTIANRDFDTGKETGPGEYDVADNTYAELLLKLQEHGFTWVPTDLRQNILGFYSSPHAILAIKRQPRKATAITDALQQLKNKD